MSQTKYAIVGNGAQLSYEIRKTERGYFFPVINGRPVVNCSFSRKWEARGVVKRGVEKHGIEKMLEMFANKEEDTDGI